MSLLGAARVVSDTANRVVVAACIVCILAMLAISFTGFLYTVLTGAALSWTYSLARLFLPWIGLLSITVALHAGEHVAMTILVRVLPPAVARLAAYAVLATVVLFGALLVWYGWAFFVSSTQYYMVSDQIQVHARWTAAAVPITGVTTLVHAVRGLDIVRFDEAAEAGELDAGALDQRVSE